MRQGNIALVWAAAVLCGASVLASAAVANAADPVVAGSTNIGTHPSYGSSYSALWRTGKDYTLLTDGTNSFFNAPSINGVLYFRGANTDWMNISKYGVYMYVPRLTNPTLAVGNYTTNTNDTVAVIGNHPSYGNGYAGFWLGTPNCSGCPQWDYSLLTDGADTFINAPDGGNGVVYVRAGNTTYFEVGPTAGFISHIGTVRKPGGGSWSALSDARVKKDVAKFEPGLLELEKIRPVTYRYNGLGGMTDTTKQYVGVIAQEVEKTLPFMVTSEKEKLRPEDAQLTDIKHVDPSAFTYVLINAVQELSAENKQLKRIICQDHPTEAICAPKAQEAQGTGLAAKPSAPAKAGRQPGPRTPAASK